MTTHCNYEAARHALSEASKGDKTPPNLPGVYAFYKTGQCMYIGESKNLRKRLGSHERNRQLLGCSITFFVCDDRKAIERRLIQEIKPWKNGCSIEFEKMQQRADKKHSATPLESRIDRLFEELFGESA